MAVSPHLDDAVFSAGGVLTLLSRAGWNVRTVTCFTASVAHPCPFALSTQLDKGLPSDADYMAIRRDEDLAAQRTLGTAPPVHLPLPEAPHRGYTSAPELFTPPRREDTVHTELERLLRPHVMSADLVLAPQGIGDHVDHLLTARAVTATAPPSRVCWWRDVPYIARKPSSTKRPPYGTPGGTTVVTVDISAVLPVKTAAARCYRTQLDFQFGGCKSAADVLSAVARREALRTGSPYAHVEALSAGTGALRTLASVLRGTPQ